MNDLEKEVQDLRNIRVSQKCRIDVLESCQKRQAEIIKNLRAQVVADEILNSLVNDLLVELGRRRVEKSRFEYEEVVK